MRQITLFISFMNKLNLRLIRVSQYLSRFNLIIRYKVDKSNIVFDALFRFQTNVIFKEKQTVLENLYDNIIKVKHKNIAFSEKISVYHMILIVINDDFKKRLIDAYNKNSQ